MREKTWPSGRTSASRAGTWRGCSRDVTPHDAATGPRAGNSGPQLFCQNPERMSDSVTAVLLPEGHDAEAVRRTLATGRGTVIFRRYYLDENADRVAARIRDFVAGEADPEIEGPVVIRHADERPPGLMPHMPPLIDWHFSALPE